MPGVGTDWSATEDVPELGVEAGTTGTIVTVYEGGRMLLVEIGREDGTSVGLVDLEVGEDGSLRQISSTPFSSCGQGKT